MADHAYSVVMDNQTVIADSELITIRAAAAATSRGSMLEILRFSVSQRGTSTAQQLGIRWGWKASAFGTFTSTTPTPLVGKGSVVSAIAGGTTNAAATCGTDSSANGAGTFTGIGVDAFNNLNGYLWVMTPDEKIVVMPDETFIIQLQGTPTTLTGWNAYMNFRELL